MLRNSADGYVNLTGLRYVELKSFDWSYNPVDLQFSGTLLGWLNLEFLYRVVKPNQLKRTPQFPNYPIRTYAVEFN